MQEIVIDLADFKSGGSRVYSGRARGEAVRKSGRLDSLDGQECVVTVKVPEDTLSINSSFFLGLFGDSVRALREEGFRNKYKFVAQEVIQANIEEGIARALKEKSVL